MGLVIGFIFREMIFIIIFIVLTVDFSMGLIVISFPVIKPMIGIVGFMVFFPRLLLGFVLVSPEMHLPESTTT